MDRQGGGMDPGIYYVIFKSQSGRFGDGLAVLDNGKIHGGDQRYLYRGFYKTEGQALEADIQVSYYRGEPKSVLGHLAKFKLNLAGKATAEAFTVSGHVFGQSHLAITIEGQKQADLLG
jgi:saccharopine dehydrogenase-like NADP-dependent oxidoreductase